MCHGYEQQTVSDKGTEKCNRLSDRERGEKDKGKDMFQEWAEMYLRS